MSNSKSKQKKPAPSKPNPIAKPPGKDAWNSFLEKRGFPLFVLVTMLLAFFVYKDFLTFKNLLIYKDIGSDTYNLFNPEFVHFSRYLRTEGIPKWSFNQGMGQNVFPGGINDPFNIFLYLFDPNNISYMIVYAQLLKILLGGIIFYHYLKTIGISAYASLTGALLFSFSGYMILGGGWYGHSSLMVYGVFLLFAFEKLYKQNSWIYFPIAVAILSSDFFSLYIFAVFLFVYVLFRYYQENDFKSTRIVTLLLKMAGLGILGIAINAVFLVSPLIQMIDSPRVSGEAGLFDTLKSAPLLDLAGAKELMSSVMRTFSSDLMGTGNDFKGWSNYLESPIFYVGLVILLLVPQVFQFLDKKRKILFGIFLSLWTLMILFPYFRHSLYLFSGDYYKSGLSFFVPVTMLFTGITALSYIDRLTKINFRTLGITLVVLLVLLFLPYVPDEKNLVDTHLRNVVVFFLILYTVVIGMMNNKAYKAMAQVALLLMLVCELGYFSSVTVNKRSILSKRELNQKIGFNDYTVDAVDYLKSIDKSFYRINKNFLSGNAMHGSFNDALIQNYYSTPSYQSFNQLYYIKFLGEADAINPNAENETRWSIGLLRRPQLQTFANIKYTLTKKTDQSLLALNDSIASFGDVMVYKNKYYLPFGYAYDSYLFEKDFKNSSNLQKDKLLFQAFVISESQKNKFSDLAQYNLKDTTNDLTFEEYANYTNALKKDTLSISNYSPNSIEGKIITDKKKLLFFSIPYDKGWHATVDGKNVEPELVNIGFMGLLLDKGNHDMKLFFEPPYVKESLWVSVVGLLLFLLGIVWWVFRKRRAKETVSQS